MSTTKQFFNTKTTKGFLLIEVIVALTIFTMVSFVSMGSALVMLDAKKKTHATQTIMDNLHFALEDIVRNVRLGRDFHCARLASMPSKGQMVEAKDCNAGEAISSGDVLAFERQVGDPDSINDQVVYKLNNGVLEKSLDSGDAFSSMTASSITIENLMFYVTGSRANDSQQSRITIIIKGLLEESAGIKTEFNIQTTVQQRTQDA